MFGTGAIAFDTKALKVSKSFVHKTCRNSGPTFDTLSLSTLPSAVRKTDVQWTQMEFPEQTLCPT